MRALRTRLLAFLLVFALESQAAVAAPFTLHNHTNNTTGIKKEGAAGLPRIARPEKSEDETDAADARGASSDRGRSSGRSEPSDENARLLAKLLMLSTMAGANSTTSAALGMK